jgi:release factor glutamine methyltransferase
MGVRRAWLHAHPEAAVSEEKQNAIMEMTDRRVSGEPLAYVMGNAIFLERTFITTPEVLIPRPETEILTGIASDLMKRAATRGERYFADWCTGSGCIAITLVLENPDWHCWAADKSAEAIEIARRNAAVYGVEDRINFIICDSPSCAKRLIPPRSLDFIVSNPPYIPAGDISSLEDQVAMHEPRMALDGGENGLDIYRLLLSELPAFMKPGAGLLFETGGAEQTDRVARLAEGSFELAGKFEDHREISRFVLLKTPHTV